MSERERIAARIRALLAKTLENGCTEAEALAAARMAADLLGKYGLTLDEVEMRASPFGRHSEKHDDAVGERLWKVADGVAHLTGASYWVSGRGVWPLEISFFGFQHEVDVARYLLEICARAMRVEEARQGRAWALLTPVARRRKVGPFLDGMADRLRQRIREMKPPAPAGKGIIVLRNSLVTEAMGAAGIKLQDGWARRSQDLEQTYGAGRAAGDRVSLRPGLTGGGAVRGLLR